MALCLTRKANQAVFIGPDIRVVVTQSGYRNGVVRLAIEAPADVNIVRQELLPVEQQRQVEAARNKEAAK